MRAKTQALLPPSVVRFYYAPMARRMFTEMVTRSDAFLDMPASTQALYFHLLSEADDDGFVSSPKMVMRIVGSSDDEIRTLVSKKFLIPFQGGVCVIKHWRMHNQVRKDRYIETKYKKEKLSLYIRGNGAYTTNPNGAIQVPSGYYTVENIDSMLLATKWQPVVALGEGRVGQVNTGDSDESRPLEDKTTDVSWQEKRSDNDDDLPTVGEDGQIKKEEKKPKRRYKEVYELFKTLGPIPLNWNMNTTQQTSAENLYTERGLESVTNALEYYKEHKGEEYLPEINSPYDLDSKWKKLFSFKQKNG